jgi:hypothetical protein
LQTRAIQLFSEDEVRKSEACVAVKQINATVWDSPTEELSACVAKRACAKVAITKQIARESAKRKHLRPHARENSRAS